MGTDSKMVGTHHNLLFIVTLKRGLKCKITDQMANHNSLLRIFKLIALLESPPKRTIKQLAKNLSIHRRTVYRYIKLLEEVGLFVDCDQENRYFLFRKEGKPNDNFFFTDEEEQTIRQLLQLHEAENPLLASLQKKLYVHSANSKIPNDLLKAKHGLLVNKLSKAIQGQRWVLIKNYDSANSGTIADRKVAPICFEENYRRLVAFEEASNMEKVFKINRMGDIQVLSVQYEVKESQLLSDAFGMSGEKWIFVTLRLSRFAAQLLREEYPSLSDSISKDPVYAGLYIYNGKVCGYQGVGRFVLGLPGEVEVCQPVGLIEYVNEKKSLTLRY